EDEIPDGDTDARRFAYTAEHAIREVLNRKMRIRHDGHPRAQRWIVGRIHGINPSARKPSRGSSKLQLPKDVTACRRADSISETVARRSRQRRPSESNAKSRAFSSSKMGSSASSFIWEA